MSFLAPFFLLGALAIGAPILFHLIRRTTRERKEFSSVMFLLPSPPSLTHRSRLEHLLLLFLRCLALGLLALGFARPFWRNAAPSDGADAQTRRVVVLVDVSASMRRTGLWDQARARVDAVLATLGPGDEASVLLFSRRVTPLVSFEEWKACPPAERRPLASRRLAASAPGWEDDRLGDALITAAETLAETDAQKKSPGPRQIYLVSDLKAGSRLDSLQAYDWPKNLELRLEPLRARNPTNAGLQLVAEAPDADRLATPSVRVRVSNAADSAREQFRVAWTQAQGGDLGPAVDVYVPPGQSRVVAVPVPERAADLRQITLRGDDEDFDNTAYVVPTEQQHWSVLYFGSEAPDDVHGPRYFLERAVPDDPHLAVKVLARAPAAAAAPSELDQAKLFVVSAPLAAQTAAELRGQMQAGKTVLFVPRNSDGAATLGELIGAAAPVLTEVQPPDYAMFGEIDFRHPLFAPFADPHYSDFTKIHIWKYRRLAPDALPGARVLARFDSGDPALVEIGVGAGRLLALLTGWNPDDSQLAVSSKFVPLIDSLLEYAGGPADDPAQYFVGDSIPLHPTGGAAIRVVGPDGRATQLPADAASFAGARAPGIYLLDNGRRHWRVAVNVAAAESRTEPLAADELERYGAPGPASPPDPARAAERRALLSGAEAESRQKLWRWLLGAALAVLLFESALAGWTTRRNEVTVAAEGTHS
jgi:hypothetical protein